MTDQIEVGYELAEPKEKKRKQLALNFLADGVWMN